LKKKKFNREKNAKYIFVKFEKDQKTLKKALTELKVLIKTKDLIFEK